MREDISDEENDFEYRGITLREVADDVVISFGSRQVINFYGCFTKVFPKLLNF